MNALRRLRLFVVAKANACCWTGHRCSFIGFSVIATFTRSKWRPFLERLEDRALLAVDLVAQWVAQDLAEIGHDKVVDVWSDSIGGIEAVSEGFPTLRVNAHNEKAAILFNPIAETDRFRVAAANNPLRDVIDFSAAVVFASSSSTLKPGDGWYNHSGIIDASLAGISTGWGIGINREGQVAAGMGSGSIGQPPDPIQSLAGGFNDGNIHAAILSRQGKTVDLYVDGALVASGPVSTAKAPFAFDIVFGNLNALTGAFFGEITELRLYNGALNAQQVSETTQELFETYVNEVPLPPRRSIRTQ